MFIAQGMNEIKKKEKTDVVVQKRTHETDVWTLWRGNSPKLSIDILNDDILNRMTCFKMCLQYNKPSYMHKKNDDVCWVINCDVEAAMH